MPEGLAPPYIEPTGPRRHDLEVIRAFARREPAGHSENFHAEGDVLLVDRTIGAVLRIGGATVLVRRDLPDDLLALKPTIEDGLGAEDFSLLDEETLFGPPVAIQMLGNRVSSWDLWGTDIEAAFAALRSAAVGGDEGPPSF